ncbi:MAG: Zn-dependent hydrolase [Candidatus Melainabacteria bacterium HGW-Melainabacteria-1]|nr:MAG: Zn-dependent hydrolase [Candidatus Melainabacteria bacterium HGW-Melainabacteria-1]
MLFRQLFDAESSTYSYLLADQELGLTLKYLLETHIHADHVTGVSELKAIFPQAKSVVSQQGGADCADIFAKHGDLFSLGELKIKALATPGHTNGCVSYYCQDRVFSGDTLLIRGCGRTDFQEGDAGTLYDSVTQQLFSLPDQTLVYPAHNYIGLSVSSIGEEKRFNSRLAGKSRAEFIAIMEQLTLPMPKKINEAVPANLKCGNPALELNQAAAEP